MIDDDDDNAVDTFINDKLVVVNVDAAEPIDMVGDDGTPFFVDAKQEQHKKNMIQSRDQHAHCNDVAHQKKVKKRCQHRKNSCKQQNTV
jgi:hypothetical protein